MTYQDIAHISEKIRFVMHTSRQLSLTSINASLAARHAGGARGFRAVSVELKDFSQQLSETMERMVSDLHAIAECVSVSSRQSRMLRYQEAAERHGVAGAVLASALERGNDRLVEISGVLAQRLQGLQKRVSLSLHLCSNGRALARSAMVEATTGGLSEAMLRNVANDVEHTVEGIYMCLKNINNYV